MGVTVSSFGKTAAGQDVRLFTVTNAQGLEMRLIEYGATMTALSVPDRGGALANIILTCPDLAGFEKCKSYFGSTAGRYCNRIALGKFSLDSREFALAVNNGPHHLHGGLVGFDKKIWQGEALNETNAVGVRFSLLSPDGDEGYPGNVKAVAEYRLNNDSELTIDLFAETDMATHVNLTNHNYWNLSGAGNGTILKHALKVNADSYLPVDETLIPTGVRASVEGTPLDFREFAEIGQRIDVLRGSAAKGYDHCFVLRSAGPEVAWAATLRDPASGRTMTITTNQPGLQFYSGNFLDGGEGSGGYPANAALCLETQYFPDTPNRPDFPTSVLRPGQKYHHRTVCKFSIEK
jgi:aldose 1-epimerase